MDRSDYCYGRIDPFGNKTPYRVCHSRGVAPGCKFFLLKFIFFITEKVINGKYLMKKLRRKKKLSRDIF